MTHLTQRLISVATALDELVNAVFGGKPGETISGTIGRACEKFSPPWWAKPARFVTDAFFGKNHCADVAAKEALRRAVTEKPHA